MTAALPAGRPRITPTAVFAILAEHHVDTSTGPVLVGIRGYYRDTMGVEGENDRGLYDDAIVLVSGSVVHTFNANTDPSRANTGTRLATLVPGLYHYTLGTHHPGTPTAYACLVQAGPVTIKRDNDDAHEFVGEFYIHIHRGGVTVTSSEGCQTIPPNQWDAFMAAVRVAMRHFGTRYVRYLLIDADPGVSTP